MTYGRHVPDERRLRGLVSDLPPPLPSIVGAVPLLGSVLEGATTPTPSIHPASPSPSPSHSPSPPSPPPPSSPITPPSPAPSTPAPSLAPSPSNIPPFLSAPPPLNHPHSEGPPSTPSTPPFTPLPSIPSTPPPFTPPPSTPSTPPPFTPSLFTPSSTPSPSQPSFAPLQSPTNPNSTGRSSFPSTDSPSPSASASPSPTDGSSLSDNRASPSPDSSSSLSDTGGSSSDGRFPFPSSTTPPGPLSSPSTLNGQFSSTIGFILSADTLSSSITPTTGGSLTPQITNVATGTSPFPDTISTQSADIISGSPSLSSATGPFPNKVGTGSSPFPLTIPTQSPVIISGSPSLINNPSSTTNGPGPNSVSSAIANPQRQLTPGQIAAIVIVLLFFLITLPIVVFILRRRLELHRAERSTRWWFATARSSQLYGDGTTEQLIPPVIRSARSSFGTTVDHSESTHLGPTHAGSTYVIPPFPTPMAEMGRGNASRPALVIDLEGHSNNNRAENRLSIGSVGSDRSQYLVVSHRNSLSANPDLLVATPMSVRPFSPSESFAFPKPPEPIAAGSGSVANGLLRPTSKAPSVTLATLPPPPGLSSSPSSFVPLIGTKSPGYTTNPFEDSSIVISPYSDMPIQVVRRSFKPTLPDELVVNLGDGVRVLHTFDDGWGLIEKIRRDGRVEERGLIPMACLKKSEEDSEELETRSESRGSSYDGPSAL